MTDTYEPFPQADAPRGEPIPPTPRRAALDFASLSLHKVLLVAGIAIATVLPNMVISNLIEEREGRQASVKQEIARNWGPEQNLYSPMLVIPHQFGDRARQYIKIAPTRLDLAANLTPQERRRGLFRTTVYEGKVEMNGMFSVPAEARLREIISDRDSRILWNEAVIVFGTASDFTGLRSTDNIMIDGIEQTLLPCLDALRQEAACRGGVMMLASAPLAPPAAGGARVQFKWGVSLRGTSSFSVQYSGKELVAKISSPWPSPSFNGNTLPVNSTVTPEGFEASWQSMEFGSPRIVSSAGVFDSSMWRGASIGVDLIEATPIYRMINRVAKYGLLFIALSFATYFFFEVLSRLRIHVVQYGMLGLSLSLFSLLLLSLAEPIGYTNGYLVAAGLVLVQSTLYTAALARRFVPTVLFALMLASLFAFIYVLLGLETYSLLIGALALFVVVSALMVLTQMVKWPGRAEAAPISA
jgi:inner membrane protein